MFKLFSQLFETKSTRDLKKLKPYLSKIHAATEQLQPLSHDALRQQTQDIRKHIQDQLQPMASHIETQKQHVATDTSLSLEAIKSAYSQIEKLQKEYNQQLATVLEEVLPTVFALVKETARRFQENQQLVVTATAYDKMLAEVHAHVQLSGTQALWRNQWEVVGRSMTWDMVHYDEQLIGGIILHQGKIAEMATGEGKTLVATLPAFLNALAGHGVHIVTVNDYLAKRDKAWMGPIYEFHGLQVACIDAYLPNTPGRRMAYQADITYGTNNEFGFDYLRDNMATQMEDLVHRSHHFAIVDEVDSVLIDDARTPLIISGPVEESDEQAYQTLNPRVQKLYEAQKQLVTQYLQEAKRQIQAGQTQEGGLSLFRAYRGLPKYKPLIKYLSEQGIKQLLHQTEGYYIQDNSRMMPEADEPLLFTIDEQRNTIELTEKGIDHITQQGEDAQFFVLPDVGFSIAQVENAPHLSEEDKRSQKEALTQDYNVKSQRIHAIHQLLKAYTLFEQDVDYIVSDSKIKIVDEQTGRVLAGRRYANGLHQALEAKEAVPIEKASQTYATITLQNYFRMYHKLAGMTGTAMTEAAEFWDIYKLDVVVTPTHKLVIRADKDDKIYKTAREKFNAVIEEITDLQQQGRPVLVGTTSVEISELVSKMLSLRKINHQVLNAKHHQREATIVAEAGKAGAVTIATNMAGRGTDIKLTPEARAAGGLAIVGTERHESRRVDRQLRGRSGRQGDVGSSQFFVSLEDTLMRLFVSDRIARLMDKIGLQEGEVIQHSMVTKSIERAQKKVEQNNYAIRKRLLEYDNEINRQRELVYQKRKDALFEKNIHPNVINVLHNVAQDLANSIQQSDNYDALKATLYDDFGIEDLPLSTDVFKHKSATEKTQLIYQTLWQAYQAKRELLHRQSEDILQGIVAAKPSRKATYAVFGFTDAKRVLEIGTMIGEDLHIPEGVLAAGLVKAVMLTLVDQHWQAHLRHMDELRQSVQNAVYEQKDPLLVYKFEAYSLFRQFSQTVNYAIGSYLLKALLTGCKLREVEAPVSIYDNPAVQRRLLNLSYSNQARGEDGAKEQPVQSKKIAGRNQRVTVKYPDGRVVENVKFKNVAQDIEQERCMIVTEA
ncbi:MAG: preprotein translocase subunit SecA [Bacteroidota bacterium]